VTKTRHQRFHAPCESAVPGLTCPPTKPPRPGSCSELYVNALFVALAEGSSAYGKPETNPVSHRPSLPRAWSSTRRTPNAGPPKAHGQFSRLTGRSKSPKTSPVPAPPSPRNGGGQVQPEWVATFSRNRWPTSAEYARLHCINEDVRESAEQTHRLTRAFCLHEKRKVSTL